MDDRLRDVELWVLVLEASLVLLGAWAWEGGQVRVAEWLASWALTAVLLSFTAGLLVPMTRGLTAASRWLLLTAVLGAVGALVTGPVMTGITLLSVVRMGLTPSWLDLVEAARIGGPAGAWLGAVAGLTSGAVLALAAQIVEGLRGDAPNPERVGAGVTVASVVAALAALALVAEAQQWAPAFMVTGCSSDCRVWVVNAGGRVLGAGLGVVGAGVAARLLVAEVGRGWRHPLGALVLVVAVLALGAGNTVFTSTIGPRHRRATLGLPPMPIPVSRDLVGAEVVERPGVLWHTVQVNWRDGHQEIVLIGLGPFRPDTGALFADMRRVAVAWKDGGGT